MASINQIVSEIAHSVQGAYTVPVRRALRLAVIHARNELIRHSFTNHRYTDKVLQQRFRVTIINVPDGDIDGMKLGDVDTIKRTDDNGKIIETPNRETLWCVQTPQVFDYNLIMDAHVTLEGLSFSDDAGMLESLGVNVYVSEGSYSNIKITTKKDIYLAQMLYSDK